MDVSDDEEAERTDMKKTGAVFIRVSEDEKKVMEACAAKLFLKVSTWARTVLLREVEKKN